MLHVMSSKQDHVGKKIGGEQEECEGGAHLGWAEQKGAAWPGKS